MFPPPLPPDSDLVCVFIGNTDDMNCEDVVVIISGNEGCWTTVVIVVLEIGECLDEDWFGGEPMGEVLTETVKELKLGEAAKIRKRLLCNGHK